MESLDYWRLCDELNVIQAALLICGCDPSGDCFHVENWKVQNRPAGYEAAKTAIANAIKKKAVICSLIPIYETDINGNECGAIEGSINLERSTVDVESMRQWLISRGFRSGFFFPNETGCPEYLDPNNPRYAPKLAAAVHAWQSVTSTGGKHPKQALTKWLREHASSFGLCDEEGKPNETGIGEVAKVSNWQPEGGAPKTPGE